MLVLSRYEKEAIVIGNNIRITIVEIRGSKIRIGIEAPNDVVILRQELVEKNQKEHASTLEKKSSEV
jgi:carbon storage regulator